MKPLPLMLRRRRRYVLAACVTLWHAAFIATHVPAKSLPKVGVGDKWLHAACFFVLGSLLMATLAAYRRRPIRRAIIAFCALTLYGALDELTQPLVNRHGAFSDWYADVKGALAAVVVWELIFLIAAKISRPSAEM